MYTFRILLSGCGKTKIFEEIQLIGSRGSRGRGLFQSTKETSLSVRRQRYVLCCMFFCLFFFIDIDCFFYIDCFFLLISSNIEYQVFSPTCHSYTMNRQANTKVVKQPHNTCIQVTCVNILQERHCRTYSRKRRNRKWILMT